MTTQSKNFFIQYNTNYPVVTVFKALRLSKDSVIFEKVYSISLPSYQDMKRFLLKQQK